ncbi:rho GTPase-activating protein 33 isoform X1 [Mobula hypostoma]|uniref:rho GTPase-activating protein 33 isoform X1 n=2 Tax=Mobula hypostoma TaxID=723540 RepID=UPI002FC288BE
MTPRGPVRGECAVSVPEARIVIQVLEVRKGMENARFWRKSLLDIFSKEESILSVARTTDNVENQGEQLRSSIRGRSGKRCSAVRGHFPKLADCAHFHYESVDFRTVQLSLAAQPPDTERNELAIKDLRFLVKVVCQGKEWLVRRSWEDFRMLDSHLHQCIYDRRFSQLPELPPLQAQSDDIEDITSELVDYLARLSNIADNKINCGPVLTWMEIDNKGNRLLVNDEAFINVPAIAAAQVIKRYTAQANDEISFEVGDIVSVIDMPSKQESTWWRGKRSFQVGYFPSECVQLITERAPASNTTATVKTDSEAAGVSPGTRGLSVPTGQEQTLGPGLKKQGTLMGYLLAFMKSRPSRLRLKQRGILRERVFGCDLGEHLLNSGLDVPQVLKSCAEFIERHGIVDGIYRLSGVSSNIQKLRHEFDCGHVPDLTKDPYLQDIHCVGSLCKLYFRELPNPLLTYQLYDHFAEAVTVESEEQRLLRVHDVIQQLPPPNYRTLRFLLRHLSTLAKHCASTGMHGKNLAIVWAPNLLRSQGIEAVGFTGADAFREVRIQSIVVEFLLSHVDVLFSDAFTSAGKEVPASVNGAPSFARKVSCTPMERQRLLTLEEAMLKAQHDRNPNSNSQVSTEEEETEEV